MASLSEQVNKFIDFSESCTLISGVKVPFKVVGDKLSKAKRESVRELLASASVVKVPCQTCSSYNRKRKRSTPQILCLVSKEFERCMLCLALDKCPDECGAIRFREGTNQIQLDDDEIGRQEASSSRKRNVRPQPRPYQTKEPIAKRANKPPLSSPPPPLLRISPDPKITKPRKESRQDALSKRVFESSQSSEDPPIQIAKVIKNNRKTEKHCKTCSCCTIAYIDKTHQELRRAEKRVIELSQEVKDLKKQNVHNNQTINDLKRRKMGGVDTLANTKAQLDISRSENKRLKRRIIELEKALRLVDRNAKDALGD